MKPLITIDYNITRIHRTPRATIKTPLPGTAIRYSIDKPVDHTSPVYMRPVPINHGETIYAAAYRGTEIASQQSSMLCIATADSNNSVTPNNSTSVSTSNEGLASPSTKPQFDGNWGSADW